MTYLLDTNTCIHLLRKRGNVRVKARFVAHASADMTLCAVVAGELYYGAERAANPAQEFARVDGLVRALACLPYDEPAARVAGRIGYALDLLGKRIGPNDLLIAAIALEHRLTLVTHNTAEFGRVPGLAIEDWEV